MTEAVEKVNPVRAAAESRRSRRRVPKAAPDTLHDAGPAGFLTPFGWRESTPAERAERLLFDAERNVADAACALHAGTIGSAEECRAALRFIAVALRREAAVIARARRVLWAAAAEVEAPGRGGVI